MTTEILRPVAVPKSLSLYPFQTEAIESLRVAARAGHHRIILCSPTGSGKTEMAIHLIQEAQAQGVSGDIRRGRNLAGGADQRSPGVLRDRARVCSRVKHLGQRRADTGGNGTDD